MMTFLTLTGLFNGFRKSLIAQIGMGIVALFGIWQINNHYVAKGAVKKVVQASKKEGKRRNANVRKIRSRIDRNGAMQRLRKEYAESGNR